MGSHWRKSFSAPGAGAALAIASRTACRRACCASSSPDASAACTGPVRGRRDAAASPASSCRISTCSLVKALGWPEKTSSRPTLVPLSTMGTAASDRSPNSRATVRFTRGSLSVSSQRTGRPVRRHSPEIPELTSRIAPRGGASEPLRASQRIAPSRHHASAVPSAPVSPRADSASRGSSMVGSVAPVPCSARSGDGSGMPRGGGIPAAALLVAYSPGGRSGQGRERCAIRVLELGILSGGARPEWMPRSLRLSLRVVNRESG